MLLHQNWQSFEEDLELPTQIGQEQTHNVKFGYVAGAQSVLRLLGEKGDIKALPGPVLATLQEIQQDIDEYTQWLHSQGIIHDAPGGHH